jgi:hypothetical protein
MATLQHQIAEKFLAKLADCKDVDAQQIAQLRDLLGNSEKPKVDDLVKIFSLPAGDLK